jgi:glucose-6-phosphate-specific signal transduction histidine kinase
LYISAQLFRSNNQYATELSPKAVKNIELYTYIEESNYKNITKSKAKNLKNRFGFAVKYTKGNQSNNITLYKVTTTNVFNLIKGI